MEGIHHEQPHGRLPEHFGEWVLPGAHSDIGGGYPHNFHEHIQAALPRRFLGQHPRDSYEYTMVLMERRQMIDQGWLGPNNPRGTLTIEEAYRRRLKEGEVELQFQLWLDRRVQAEYSRVALRQMYRLAKDAGVPLNAVEPITSTKANHCDCLLQRKPCFANATFTTQPITRLQGHFSHSNPHPVTCELSIQTGGSNDEKVRDVCGGTLLSPRL